MNEDLEYKAALNRLRGWLRIGAVKLVDGYFVRGTEDQNSRRLFIKAVTSLDGEIASEDKQPFPKNKHRIFYVLKATLPLTLDDIAAPERYRGGRPKLPYETKRHALNVRLMGQTITQAKKYAVRHDLPNFWHSLDRAMDKLSDED